MGTHVRIKDFKIKKIKNYKPKKKKKTLNSGEISDQLVTLKAEEKSDDQFL